LIGHELLELAVLLLQQAQAQALGVPDLQAAELLLPLVIGGLADAVAAAGQLLGFAALSEDIGGISCRFGHDILRIGRHGGQPSNARRVMWALWRSRMNRLGYPKSKISRRENRMVEGDWTRGSLFWPGMVSTFSFRLPGRLGSHGR